MNYLTKSTDTYVYSVDEGFKSFLKVRVSKIASAEKAIEEAKEALEHAKEFWPSSAALAWWLKKQGLTEDKFREYLATVDFELPPEIKEQLNELERAQKQSMLLLGTMLSQTAWKNITASKQRKLRRIYENPIYVAWIVDAGGPTTLPVEIPLKRGT